MRTGLRLTIESFPVASYHHSADPIAAVGNCPSHIPVPNTAVLQTTDALGEPIKFGGYINDRPCWVQVKRHVVTLEVAQKVNMLPFVISRY